MLAGCGSSDSPSDTGNNKPPTIESNFKRIAVGRGTTATITVTVDDPDMDNVVVTWAATGGLLTSADQGKTVMHWTAPSNISVVTLTMTADDGNGGKATITQDIQSATRLFADVSAATSWGIGSSPYLLDPAGTALFVRTGASLTIDAGVEVLVHKADMAFQIEGILTTSGTVANPVVIHYNNTDNAAGSWAGILASPNSPSDPIPEVHLNYTHIANGVNGVKLINAIGTLRTSKITFSSADAIYHQGADGLLVDDCLITNNTKSAIRVDESIRGLPAFITLRRDTIAFNGDTSGQTSYTDGEAGVSLNLLDPDWLVPITITGCNIARNGYPGVRLTGAMGPVIQGNSIYGNQFGSAGNRFNLRLEPGFTGPGTTSYLAMTNNYWAWTDSVSIHNQIFDRSDGFQSETFVYVTPWSNTEL